MNWKKMNWKKEKTVVAGGYGFIASHLIDRLASLHANIRIVDDHSRGRQDNIFGALEQVVMDDHQMPVLLSGVDDVMLCGNEIVFHLAAKVTGIHYNLSHNLDMLQSNIDVNSMVVRACINAKPKLLVWVSTACIYPHDAPVPTPESYGDICNPEPTNFGYGVAKWVGEQQAKYLCKEYGIPTIIVRFFNAFGPRDYYDRATSHVAPALIRRVMEGEDPLVVWGSGEQTRVFVDARDIAKALAMLTEMADQKLDDIVHASCRIDGISDIACVPVEYVKDVLKTAVIQEFPWVVNIGHSREISIADLAYTIVDIAHDKYSITKPNVVFDTSKPDGYPRRAADTTHLESLIDWVPDTPLKTTLKDMFEDYLRQKEMGWIND